MLRPFMTLALVLALTACGASDSPPADDGNTASSDTCHGHSVGDACVDEAAFAACQSAEAECGTEVLELESCPLQFQCP